MINHSISNPFGSLTKNNWLLVMMVLNVKIKVKIIKNLQINTQYTHSIILKLNRYVYIHIYIHLCIFLTGYKAKGSLRLLF